MTCYQFKTFKQLAWWCGEICFISGICSKPFQLSLESGQRSTCEAAQAVGVVLGRELVQRPAGSGHGEAVVRAGTGASCDDTYSET